MNLLLSNFLSFLTFLALAFSILSLWIPSRFPIWLYLSGITLVLGLFSQRIAVLGFVAVIIFGMSCYGFYRNQSKSVIKFIFALTLIFFAFVMGSHKFPGFRNWLILSNYYLSHDSQPFRFFLNFDKPFIGLFLIGFGLNRATSIREWKNLLKLALPIGIVCSLVLLVICLLISYVRFDFKWFEFSGIWIISNLLFTCVPEEAFFRGFVQQQLMNILVSHKLGNVIALVISSILFGLAHVAGGWNYVGLAFLAGLFFGYAYLSTKKIEASIFVHILFNSIHFVFFSYPAWKGNL